MTRWRILLLCGIICILSFYVIAIMVQPKTGLSYVPHQTKSDDVDHRNAYETDANLAKQTKNEDVKYILYWTPFWHIQDYYIGLGSAPFESCEYKNCYATSNRTHVSMRQFDALIFHATIYNKREYGVPAQRYPHQRYITMNVEAPIYICPDLKKYSSFYNWTMTYRFDSDLVWRHGTVTNKPMNYTAPSVEDIKKRPKFAAWFVSHCTTGSRRELIKKVREYIPLDIYGSCGNLTCKKKDTKLSSTACYDMVERDYKFYFSFENSYCQDYSTEKLYNILRRNVVPVVYGFGDYNSSAPPHSVINVADFDSLKEFANYLKYLVDNPEEYLKYFLWKKNAFIDTGHRKIACQICKKLNEDAQEKVYDNLHRWWWGKKNAVCRTNKALPKIVVDLM